MALIFLGSTECGICNKVLMDNDDVIGLPAISNLNHRLHRYFDMGFHQECFDNWIEKPEIQAILDNEM
jgi:hypothetical protein